MQGIQFGITLIPNSGYALVVGVHQITMRNLLDERLAFLLLLGEHVMALAGPVRLSFAMLFGKRIDSSLMLGVSLGQGSRELSRVLGPLRRAFLTWISEFLTGRLSMSVSHLRPKLASNPETSKKE
jgi:hypothetical protein